MKRSGNVTQLEGMARVFVRPSEMVNQTKRKRFERRQLSEYL